MSSEREVLTFLQEQVAAAIEEFRECSIESFMWKERAKVARKRAQRLEQSLVELGGEPDERIRRRFDGVPDDVRYWDSRGGEPPTKYDWREVRRLCGADFGGDRGGFGDLKCARTLGHKGAHYADRDLCEKHYGENDQGYGGHNCTLPRGHSGNCGASVLQEAERIARQARRRNGGSGK